LAIHGWCDGGAIVLRMGINNKLKKSIEKSAYLHFDAIALHSLYRDGFIHQSEIVAFKIVKKDTTQNWNLEIQRLAQVIEKTNIPTLDLAKIKAQVFIIAGDKEAVKGAHSLEIYKNILQDQ
jgi:hypothetical protein